MADYLSREEILRVFDNLTVKNPDDKYQHGMQDAIDCLIPEVINGMEAKDVQSVKHAEWLKVSETSWNNYKCSLCDTQYAGMGAITFTYCPNCGARMDGEQNEDN